MRQFPVTCGCLLLLLSNHCSACLWDYDTLAMERQRFPEAHELIAGHFVRHSTAYYEWRLSDRAAKPIDQRTPIDFDDIAVAYDKLGQHEKAIETIRDKIARWPDDSRYESEANLGTFLIHAGRLADGLQHIKRAIELNPDAHFGREIYQQLLVEYVLECRGDGDPLPLSDQLTVRPGFSAYVLAAREPQESGQAAEIQRAVKGVLGMMRFGHYDSPVLLEALGDLLLFEERADSKMLAARAYLKASCQVDDPSVSAAYREKAQILMSMQFGRELAEVEADFKSEIEQGDRFFRQVAVDERAWVVAGVNLDTHFANKYYESPELALAHPDWDPSVDAGRRWFLAWGILAACVAGCLIFLSITVLNIKRKKKHAAALVK